jgi:hypothetical protein
MRFMNVAASSGVKRRWPMIYEEHECLVNSGVHDQVMVVKHQR